MCDNFTKATSDDTDFSTSLASLREWFNQVNVLILYLVQLATAKAQVLYLEKPLWISLLFNRLTISERL